MTCMAYAYNSLASTGSMAPVNHNAGEEGAENASIFCMPKYRELEVVFERHWRESCMYSMVIKNAGWNCGSTTYLAVEL